MAGDLQSVGFEGITFGPIAVDYGPNGMTTHFNATCPTIDPLISYLNYIETFGGSGTLLGADLGVDGATTAADKSLSVSLPGLVNNLGLFIHELFFDKWELLNNEGSDSIFDNPLIVGTPGGPAPLLNYNDKCVLSRLARDGGTLTQAISSLNSDAAAGLILPPTPGAGPLGGGAAGTGGGPNQFQKPGTLSVPDIYGGTAPGQLAIEIIKGQVEYEKPTRVLRHTSYCSGGSTYNSGRTNEQCIYATAQLLTEVGSGWTYNLPPRLYTEINAIPTQYAALAESPYYTWGWLKKITREPVQANFMVEISTEYELGLWSNLRYALA